MVYTNEQKKQLTDLIAKWQDRLRLQHWHITVDWDEPADVDNGLEIGTPANRHVAEIRVGCFFDDSVTDAERENMVCHELVHLLLWRFEDVALRAADELSAQAASMHRKELDAALEWAVDALANAFVPIN